MQTAGSAIVKVKAWPRRCESARRRDSSLVQVARPACAMAPPFRSNCPRTQPSRDSHVPCAPREPSPKLLGRAQTAGLGLCPRPRRGSERRGHPASLADDSLGRRGRQPRSGTDLEECRLELCQTSERSVAVVARAVSLTVLVAPSRQVEPRPGGGAIPGTDRSIRRGASPAGGRTDDSARVRWPSSEMSRSVLPMVATPGSQRFGGRTLPIQAQRGHGVRVTQIGVIQQRTAAGAGKRDGGRQARHERRESKALLPPRGRSHKRMALRTRRCQPR